MERDNLQSGGFRILLQYYLTYQMERDNLQSGGFRILLQYYLTYQILRQPEGWRI